MYKSKEFSYNYDDYSEGKNAKSLIADIIADRELASLEEIVIGSWGNAWEDNCQDIIDGIVANKDKFSNIKSLFIGDMDYSECEVSWILQGDYSKLWDAMPQLEVLCIKGSNGLVLGDIQHGNLKHLEIICGGLPVSVIESVKKAKLPSLTALMLYIGIENYGFDGDIGTIKNLLDNSDFPNLKHLGIEDSEIQDDIAKIVFESKYISQITTLVLANGTLTDKGGQIILDGLKKYANIKTVDLQYHYMTDSMMEKLDKLADELGIEINLDDDNEPEKYDGELYYYPALTE